MADEFDHHHHQHHQTNNNICNGTNWWDPSARNRFDSGGSSSTTSTAGINSTSIGSFVGSWTPAARSDTNNNNDSMDSVSVTGSSNSMVFQDHTTHEKLQGGSDDRGGGGVLMDHGLQMMGLGLSSQAMDWNQALLSGKHEGGFRSILQEDHQNLSSNTSYQQETGMALSPQQHFQWRTQQKMFPGGGEEESSITQGLSISTSSNFQIDNSSIYESPSPSTMLQSFLGSSHHHHQPQHDQSPFENHHRSMDYHPNYVANYGMNTNEVLLPNKFSHFMRSTSSPPKQPAVPPHNQLHFSNNAPFWNASATTTTTTMSDHVPLSFLPNSLQQQSQFSMPPTFDEKPMKPNASEVRNSSSVPKKSGSEVSMKRPRNETSSSPLPAFKVRKEKMGDRITSLQQLVSPFGKTDTASVLSEAIEYIKFLHEQVAVLSTPYMKSGASIQHHHQSSDKSKDSEGPRQDLRSRGLCLVPISSTFPVAHETTVDFWTPTFGGTFR